MTRSAARVRPWLAGRRGLIPLVAATALFVVWTFSGLWKIVDPGAFMRTVREPGVLPSWFVPVAWTVGIAEVLLGALIGLAYRSLHRALRLVSVLSFVLPLDVCVLFSACTTSGVGSSRLWVRTYATGEASGT